MSKVLVTEQYLSDIGSAIRAKAGTSEAFKPAQMASAIGAIPSGDTEIEDAIVTRTLTSYENSRVSSIGSNAFYACWALTTINFPNVTNIGSSAFYYCRSLATVSFPSATSIGDYAFTYCSLLTIVSLPNVTGIRSGAFRYCYNLLSLYLLGSSIATLSSTNAFFSTPISSYTTSTGGVYGSIYVPASLYSSYKTATNWTAFSSRFVSV